ncbi:MAG: hypothetical protein UX36_C0006G0001 [Microgenomates group bacterium GW2011_GWC1_46_15]|nr:MAG: hypothetical protein UX36_C0006G0001 [Microgenomates group bacterium GW2011_GWC1_46_15]
MKDACIAHDSQDCRECEVSVPVRMNSVVAQVMADIEALDIVGVTECPLCWGTLAGMLSDDGICCACGWRVE